eukprot:3941248-Rhodomonas_salina.3
MQRCRLAKSLHESSKRWRVLEEVSRAGRGLVALSPAQSDGVTCLLAFLGRYSLLLARPPLPLLATVTQLASQVPPTSPRGDDRY